MVGLGNSNDRYLKYCLFFLQTLLFDSLKSFLAFVLIFLQHCTKGLALHLASIRSKRGFVIFVLSVHWSTYKKSLSSRN